MTDNPYAAPGNESVAGDRSRVPVHGRPDWLVRLLYLALVGGVVAATRVSILVWVTWKPLPVVALLSALTFASPAWLLVLSRDMAFAGAGRPSFMNRLLFVGGILAATWVFVLGINGASTAAADLGIRVASGILVCATIAYICYHNETSVAWWSQLVMTFVGYLLVTGLPFLFDWVFDSVAGEPVTTLDHVVYRSVINMVRVFSMGLLASTLHCRSISVRPANLPIKSRLHVEADT